MSVKRYDAIYADEIRESIDGEFVIWEDYEKLESELSKLKEKLKRTPAGKGRIVMKNFFELISEIEVKEGTTIKFKNETWKYENARGTEGYAFWRSEIGTQATVPMRASEKGWEEVKSNPKTLKGYEAIKHMISNPGEKIKSTNEYETIFFFFGMTKKKRISV